MLGECVSPKKNWKVLASLFPAGWQQMAWQSGAVERLRGFPSLDVLLRTLMLHVALGYSLRETVVRARLANWADVSDVALLKRLRKSEEWLRFLCVELLRENVAYVERTAEFLSSEDIDFSTAFSSALAHEPGKIW